MNLHVIHPKLNKTHGASRSSKLCSSSHLNWHYKDGFVSEENQKLVKGRALILIQY